MLTIRPTYGAGFARNKAESQFPELWDGLVGLWSPSLGPTGLTLRDWSGNQNNGTLTNMDAGDWVVGEKGYALDYDGSNDFVDAGDGIEAYFLSDMTMTIMAWVRPGALDAGLFSIAAKTDEFGSRGFYLAINANKSRGSFSKFDGGNVTASRVGATTLSDGVWVHLATTYDFVSGIVHNYLNGELDDGAGVNNSGIVDQATWDLTLGARNNGASNRFVGQIGDVFIHNSVLTPNEVAAMTAGAHPLTPKRRAIVKAPSVQAGLLLKQSNMDGGMQTLNGGLV